jgi:hypothetical protein
MLCYIFLHDFLIIKFFHCFNNLMNCFISSYYNKFHCVQRFPVPLPLKLLVYCHKLIWSLKIWESHQLLHYNDKDLFYFYFSILHQIQLYLQICALFIGLLSQNENQSFLKTSCSYCHFQCLLIHYCFK